MAKKYYAVKTGLTPGVYEDWESCKAQVDGYPKAEFKSFRTKEEAEAFAGISAENRPSEKPAFNRPVPAPDCGIAYVDGSYNEAAGRFSYGVVFFTQKDELHMAKAFSNADLLKMRNVAGEIMGAGQAMRTAREMGLKELVICHDYEGIAKWCTGEWKTNREWTKAYKKFYEEVSADVRIRFIKVKAHSKDPYNDLADELAKSAL